jgi:hypothetical protein
MIDPTMSTLFTTNNGSLPANDDGSSPSAVDIGFPVNYFGTTTSAVFVNNNGNITFGSGLSAFTPSPLASLGQQIIAPFWADVDTRTPPNGGGGTVTAWGQDPTFTAEDGTVHKAFAVTWNGVDYYNTQAVDSSGMPNHNSKLNFFQLILIDRSDPSDPSTVGNFDIEFNYDGITWETGDASGGHDGLGGTSARVGYANVDSTTYEFPGSGTPGSFLDGGPQALASNSNVGVPGRWIFAARGGQVDPPLLPNGVNTLQSGVENGTPEQANNTQVSVQFIDGDPHEMGTDFTNSLTPQAASYIDWGDGTPGNPDTSLVNAGDIQQVGSNATSTTWQIDGRHTYTEGGVYPITVHVVDAGGSRCNIRAGSANVPDAGLLVSSQLASISATENGDPFSGNLLNFSDADTGATPPGPGDYTVRVDWGDSTVETAGAAGSSITVTQPGGPGTDFEVAGTHTYYGSGDFNVHVTITDNKDKNTPQQSTSADIPVHVADAAVTVQAPPVPIPDATVGQSYSGAVAEISDPDLRAKQSDFSGTISWGPGGPAPTPFTVSPELLTPGRFLIKVSGVNFPSDGTFSVTVNLTEQDRDGGGQSPPIQTVTAGVGSVKVMASGGGGIVSIAVDTWLNKFDVEKTLKQQVDNYVSKYLRDLRAGLQKAGAQRRDLAILYQLFFEETQIGNQMAQMVRDNADAFATPDNLQRLQDWGLLDAAFKKEIQQALQAALALRHKPSKPKKHH